MKRLTNEEYAMVTKLLRQVSDLAETLSDEEVQDNFCDFDGTYDLVGTIESVIEIVGNSLVCEEESD